MIIMNENRPLIGIDLASLDTDIIGKTFYCHDRVESTNDLARELANRGTPEGTLVLAEEQIAGRGRQGRQWRAPHGSSLLMSLVFYPKLEPPQVQRLTMACSLATAEAITQTTGLPAGLKWPNDLLVNGRKVAGILTETSITGQSVAFVVVGMGINVNFERALLQDVAPQASTLASEAGRDISRETLLRAVLYKIEAWMPAIYQPETLRAAWAGRLQTLGREVTVANQGGTVHGLAEGVDADGVLLVRDDQGRLHRMLAGDVTTPSSS